MTMESEVKEYLQAEGLPKDEGTYPDELMGQIVIRVIEDLQGRVTNCEDELVESVPEEDLWDAERNQQRCELKIQTLEENLEDVTAQRDDLNKRLTAMLNALDRMRRNPKK